MCLLIGEKSDEKHKTDFFKETIECIKGTKRNLRVVSWEAEVKKFC